MQKIVFLGASNIFGVGIHAFRDYYLNSDNVNSNLLYSFDSHDNLKFIKENRFSGLISSYLNLKEENRSEAGGSPAQSLYLLSKMNLDEIDYVVFEISALNSFFDRFLYDKGLNNPPKTPSEIEAFLTNGKNDNPELREKIYKWLDGFNYSAFVHELFDKLRDLVENTKRIKFIFLIWRKFNIKFPCEKTDWILDYTPTFPIDENVSNIYVEKYLTKNKLRVCDEFVHYELLGLNPKHPDVHPSLNGHIKIFEIIKSYIDEKNSTNSW